MLGVGVVMRAEQPRPAIEVEMIELEMIELVPTAPVTLSFEAFYREHFRRVVALSYGLSGSRSAAEELAQDAFMAAHATRGCVLFAQGDAKAAFKALEKAMKAGSDPDPRPELAADPKYRDLALQYRIPVELGDVEAAALGLE